MVVPLSDVNRYEIHQRMKRGITAFWHNYWFGSIITCVTPGWLFLVLGLEYQNLLCIGIIFLIIAVILCGGKYFRGRVNKEGIWPEFIGMMTIALCSSCIALAAKVNIYFFYPLTAIVWWLLKQTQPQLLLNVNLVVEHAKFGRITPEKCMNNMIIYCIGTFIGSRPLVFLIRIFSFFFETTFEETNNLCPVDFESNYQFYFWEFIANVVFKLILCFYKKKPFGKEMISFSIAFLQLLQFYFLGVVGLNTIFYAIRWSMCATQWEIATFALSNGLGYYFGFHLYKCILEWYNNNARGHN